MNTSLIAEFEVYEDEIRKEATHNNDKVYEDSCVECFFSIPNSTEYYNFEISASSFMLVGKGNCRDHRSLFDEKLIENIDRKVTIIDETPFKSHWKLKISIDLVQWGLIPKDVDIKGYSLKANFYKCGNKLKDPHYLSLFEINSKTPDFHMPDSFGKLVFV